MHSASIEKLIKLFSKFPTVGPRTAARFVFYLIKQPKEETTELLKSIEELQDKIKICSWCYKSFESKIMPNKNGTKSCDRSELSQNENALLCSICSDPRRDEALVCIVEKEVDLEAVEKTRQYKGLYFILDGAISGLKSEQQKQALEARVNKLVERIKNGTNSCDRRELSQNETGAISADQPASAMPKALRTGRPKIKIKEVILALNPTTEGQNTALWLRRKLEPTGIKITQLARGLPVGGELEYADEETLGSALSGRK